MDTEPYDFQRCKLCGAAAAAPRYRLKATTIQVCAACDFHFITQLDVMPGDQPETEIRTLDVVAWNFIEKQLKKNRPQLERRLDLVAHHTPLHETECLDIGAGVGLFGHLLEGTGAIPFGIEPQLVFRQFAEEKYRLQLRAETIDHPYWQERHAGRFAVVTLWDTLEHLNFPVETLRDAIRVMRPGGLLFLDTPSRDSLYYRISEWSYRLSNGANPLFLNSLYSPKPFRHKQIFTVRQLTELIERLGLELVELNRSGALDSSNKIVLVAKKPEKASA
ncbi:class I SAM-dependent methyltransferase [Trichloromonas sp.]|uniref:class I SAM-dependent methyltransferase n=1 Tax=Trichloromonas sp. TaxID=3069249 RepID=UPI002A3A3269|nr:class I SAM-dependent methyltransferase [Trichloromonas sp.]